MVALQWSGRGAASTHLEKMQTATTSISHCPESLRWVTKSIAHIGKGINYLYNRNRKGLA